MSSTEFMNKVLSFRGEKMGVSELWVQSNDSYCSPRCLRDLHFKKTSKRCWKTAFLLLYWSKYSQWQKNDNKVKNFGKANGLWSLHNASASLVQKNVITQRKNSFSQQCNYFRERESLKVTEIKREYLQKDMQLLLK